MQYEQGSRWCKTCNGQVLAQRPTVNHILHLLLTLVSCGWWAPVWLLLALSPGAWRCSRCGKVIHNPLIFVIAIIACLAVFGFMAFTPIGMFTGTSKTRRPPRPPAVTIESPDEEETKAAPVEPTPEHAAITDTAPDIEPVRLPEVVRPEPAEPEPEPEPVPEPDSIPPEPIDFPTSSRAGFRTWTDATGTHTVEARFKGYAAGSVRLKKSDGTIIKLPMEKLSEADQNWIRDRAK